MNFISFVSLKVLKRDIRNTQQHSFCRINLMTLLSDINAVKMLQ